jgi:hypothetical protein
VKLATKKNVQNGTVFPMEADTGFYQHPSAKGKGACCQGVEKLPERGYCSVSQWSFPDTAKFQADYLTCDATFINEHMEKYAKMVLTLLCPHRSAEDLQLLGMRFPHVMKLRQIFEDDEARQQRGEACLIFSATNKTYLQNIQNTRNSLPYKANQDELMRTTKPFQPKDGTVSYSKNSEEEEEESDADECSYEMLMTLLSALDDPGSTSENDHDPNALPDILQDLSFEVLHNDRKRKRESSAEVATPTLAQRQTTRHPSEPFLSAVALMDEPSQPSVEPLTERKRTSTRDLATLLLRKTNRITASSDNPNEVNLPDAATGTVANIQEWGREMFKGDAQQQRAFECIVASFLLTFFDAGELAPSADRQSNQATLQDETACRHAWAALLKLKGNSSLDICNKHTKSQLLCLLHGPGGSGKSTVINLVQLYASKFCEGLNHPYTSRTIVVTAMSGVAATLLHGETTHSVLGLCKSTKPSREECDMFKDTRLIVIDEISFASDIDIKNIFSRMRQLGDRNGLYGGFNVVFSGDYSQLEPVQNKGTTVYNNTTLAEFHNMLNCYIELEGMHRFRDDPEWGELLKRFRNGLPLPSDIHMINERCIVSPQHQPPPGIQVASYTNETRDTVNTKVFEDYCSLNKPTLQGALNSEVVLIFMDELEIMAGNKTYVPLKSNRTKRAFYTTVGEHGCKIRKASFKNRVDPVLKLYPGCPMMHTQNTDVTNGIANGTRITVQKVIIKPGENFFPVRMKCGTTVQGLFASQVKSIVVEHTAPDITPATFEVKPEQYQFKCKPIFGNFGNSGTRASEISLKGMLDSILIAGVLLDCS